MKQVSKNVFVSSEHNICNLGLITTKQGVVLIDTPTKPSMAVKWCDEAAQKGEIKYLIITEEHPDHCRSGYFFPGTLIASEATAQTLAKTSLDEVMEGVKRSDPEGLPLMKSYKVRVPDIIISGTTTLTLGDQTIVILPMPGHSPGGLGVYIPQERVVFTTDIIFHGMKSWLQDSTPEAWLQSLRILGNLDVDVIVPGHGALCNKDYLKVQGGIIEKWVEAAKTAIKQGLSLDEAIAKVASPDPYPVQPGLPLAPELLNKQALTRLYKLYS